MTDSEPTVEEVLAEVEQRRAARVSLQAEHRLPARELSPAERRLVVAADRAIFWLAQHWLAIANTLALLYIGLPFLAPALMYLGLEGAAKVIYTMYRPLCHQLPYRSWYLFGSQWHYTAEEMARLVGAEGLVPHGYIGDATIGYKVGLCQRDTAIYGTILLTGLIYGLTRRKLRPLPLWAYFLVGIVPIGLDGGLQFLYHVFTATRSLSLARIQQFLSSINIPSLESTPLRRVITGALFGLATVWLAYPNLQEASLEIKETLGQRFGWKRRKEKRA